MFNRRHEDDPPSAPHHPHPYNGATKPQSPPPQLTVSELAAQGPATAPHLPAHHQPSTTTAHHHSPALSPRSVRQRAEDLVTSLTPPASPLPAPRESLLAGPEKRKEEPLFLPKQGDNDEEALLPLAMGQALVWKTWEGAGQYPVTFTPTQPACRRKAYYLCRGVPCAVVCRVVTQKRRER